MVDKAADHHDSRSPLQAEAVHGRHDLGGKLPGGEREYTQGDLVPGFGGIENRGGDRGNIEFLPVDGGDNAFTGLEPEP